MDVDSGFEGKLPPHNAVAEESVLGGLMLDPEAWDAVADRLQAADFYRGDNRLIYDAIATLVARNRPFDAVMVGEYLEQTGKLDEAGGLPNLVRLARDVSSAANIRAYADIVHDYATRRQLIRAGTQIIEECFAREGKHSRELLDEAERRVFGIAERSRNVEQVGALVEHLVPQAIADITRRYEGEGTHGLATGLTDFDRLTTGLHPGDLVILAGRPAMGKTSLALNWVEAAAMLGQRKPCVVFSMEMPAVQLAVRLISAHGRIHQQHLRTGELSDEEWVRINSAANTLREAKIVIDDTPAMSPNELRARCRRLKREHDIGLIVVDYIQLMQVPGTRENRTNEISEISRSLKTLAKEIGVPVVALSQLNRGVEQRDNKRPRMSDLRESGGIEQDADLIVFIYRDEVYNPDSPDKGTAEIIITKQRNGPTGTVRTAFLGHYTKFENLAAGYGDGEAGGFATGVGAS